MDNKTIDQKGFDKLAKELRNQIKKMIIKANSSRKFADLQLRWKFDSIYEGGETISILDTNPESIYTNEINLIFEFLMRTFFTTADKKVWLYFKFKNARNFDGIEYGSSTDIDNLLENDFQPYNKEHYETYKKNNEKKIELQQYIKTDKEVKSLKKYSKKIEELQQIINEVLDNDIRSGDSYGVDVNEKPNVTSYIPSVYLKHHKNDDFRKVILTQILGGFLRIKDNPNKDFKVKISSFKEMRDGWDDDGYPIWSTTAQTLYKEVEELTNFIKKNFADFESYDLNTHIKDVEQKKNLEKSKNKEEIIRLLESKKPNKNYTKAINNLNTIVTDFINNDLEKANNYRIEINGNFRSSEIYLDPSHKKERIKRLVIKILDEVSKLNEKQEEKIKKLTFSTTESYWGRDDEGYKTEMWDSVDEEVLCVKGTKYLKKYFQDFTKDDYNKYVEKWIAEKKEEKKKKQAKDIKKVAALLYSLYWWRPWWIVSK